MRKRTSNCSSLQKDAPHTAPLREKRVSLEEKILLMIRRYRASEKRRLKRRTGTSKHIHRENDGKISRLQSTGDQKASLSFEQAARVCGANTLAWKVSATLAPKARGFVAGRLLLQGRPWSVDWRTAGAVGDTCSPDRQNQ